MKIAIIGAGASALFCGGVISQKGFDVSIFDGNEKVGKKLFITGKGRCNITNACSNQEFFENVIRGEKFLFSAINNFTPFETIDFFENLSLRTKIERGNRVFPESDKSSDVIKALQKHCQNCEIRLGEKVVAVTKKEKFLVVTTKGKFEFDKVIIATGGKSYSSTGSSGDGFKFAKSFGHSVIEPKPALVPIELKDEYISKIQGVSLKNVKLKAIADKVKFEEFGEMLFTHNGITGPIVLSLSSKINRFEKIDLFLDFKPALTNEQLENRLIREFEDAKNKNIQNVIRTLLPSSLVEIFLNKCNISKDKKINCITVNERDVIVSLLKNFKLNFKNFYPFDCAIITSGGVDLKQINPKTMESKLVDGLYFIGEILDVDALTGGFNLQIAFATAFACANNI